MSRLSADDLKKIHQDDAPRHVEDFNAKGGIEKYGGRHFDDPDFQAERVEKPSNKPDFRRGTARPATPKMVKFLRDLVEERAPDTDPAFTEQVIAEGFDRVKKAIDNLKAMPKANQKIEKSEPTTRLNRYKGQCEDCGGVVHPEEGHLTKTDDGKWEVVHTECPPSDFDFPFGRYAVDTDEGHLAFYILDHQGLWLQVSDEKHRLPTNAIKAVADKIAADPEAASIRYGLELQQCGRCGRTLTNEDSRAQGIGPECAKKGW